MFPFSDNLKGASGTTVIAALILLMAVAHAPSFLDPSLGYQIVRAYGFVPLEFSVAPWSSIYKIVTSVFLHGDLFHVAGNCLFLWVFGRSLLRLFGAVPFLLAFPLLGAAGLFLHWVIYPSSRVPVIGASGAVATLMGAYLALFPSARIKIFALFGGFGAPFTAPAWAFLLYWGGLELLSLLGGTGEADRVAYAVHVGGFIAGVMAAIIWKVAYPFAEETLSEFSASAFKS